MMFVKVKAWRKILMLLVTFVFLALAVVPTLALDLPQPDVFLDVDWYRENQILAADRWNGGLDGESGMGAYQDDFNGFFHVNLDQQWNQMPMRYTTAVAQSRGIYMNVEAYRTAGESDGQRFLEAARAGADFLLANFWDSELGGFYWEVSQSGIVGDNMKQGYGNVHPLFALIHVYSITQDPIYFDAAMAEFDVIKEHFFDPAYPGAILPGFSRDFSEIRGVNNIDTFTHLFETLLALYDNTEGEQQQEIADLITLHGDFLTQYLYHDQEGFDDRGYVAYNYDEEWQPSQIPYSRGEQWSGALQASTGHNIELAYLLSRAVERGFDEAWLGVAEKLIKFCLEYAIEPVYGGMIYEITDYNGLPLDGNPDNPLFIYWAQMETARALLHFTVVRGDDFALNFKAVETLIHEYLTDQEYGGLWHAIDITRDLAPTDTIKGDVWKTNYHFTMFFVEVLRLAEQYPERVAELNAGVVEGA